MLERAGEAAGFGFRASRGRKTDASTPLARKRGSNKLESELLKDSLRGAIIGMVPGIDFREPRFMPSILEHAARRFRCEAYAPARLYEMEADLEFGSLGV
jgi:hypothetical protein